MKPGDYFCSSAVTSCERTSTISSYKRYEGRFGSSRVSVGELASQIATEFYAYPFRIVLVVVGSCSREGGSIDIYYYYYCYD